MFYWNNRTGYTSAPYESNFVAYSSNGQNHEAKTFLQHIIDFSRYGDTSGWTWLHNSVYDRDAEMTKYLVDTHFHVNVQTNSGITPLMLAVNNGDVNTVRILMENNADIYLTNKDGKSSLEIAFRNQMVFPMKNSCPVIEILFEKVNDDFSNGKLTDYLLNANEFIKLAVLTFGSVEIMKFMLKFGCSIDYHETKSGFTALHIAVIWRRIERANMLINLGANVDFLNKEGRSASYYYYHDSLDSRIDQLDEKSRLLTNILKRTNRMSVRNNCGLTDVEILLKYAKKQSVKSILLSGIDLNVCFSPNNNLLLHLIKTNENLDVLELFDEFNIACDVNTRYENGYTPLILSAVYGYSKKIQLLLNYNADVNAKTPDGYTSLSIARKYSRWVVSNHSNEMRQAKIIDALLQYGADNVESYFEAKKDEYENSFPLEAESVIAHLAMIEGYTSLTDETRKMIEARPKVQDYFDLCNREIEIMKRYKIHGTVTVFKLLSEKESRIAAYARNKKLISAMNNAVDVLTNLKTYYVNRLRGRISRGIETARLHAKVALAIEMLTGLCSDDNHAIIYQIINYLNRQDLRNLCDICP